MKVTAELLRKYANQQCNPAEQEAVEKWLASNDATETPLALTSSAQEDRIWKNIAQETKEQHIWLMRENNAEDMDTDPPTTRILPLFNKLIKYAAAACILLTVFFAGRYSVPTATAHPVEDKSPQNHLYIQGENGAKGNLPGEAFNITFNGTISLFNSSLKPKRIQVGEQTFTLGAYSTYFLSGSVEQPVFYDTRRYPDSFSGENELSGDFSFRRIDK